MLITIGSGFIGSGFAVNSSAASLAVPNGSFESPATTFVDTRIDSWQKASKPDWYAESSGYTWDELTGVFANTATNSADHIDNCDGAQAMWMFAVPDVAVFQDYNSIDWSHLIPPHDFDVTFEPGKAYRLTVGVIGGGGGMLEGASLQLSLYYRDAASNMLTVASAILSNSPTVFSNTTHLVDFQVNVPTVTAADRWAGQKLGIQMLSTVSSNLEGGYWDIDNVRLSSFVAPRLAGASVAAGQFRFTVSAEPGQAVEISSAESMDASPSNWTALTMVTNTLAGAQVSIPALPGQHFYRARLVP